MSNDEQAGPLAQATDQLLEQLTAADVQARLGDASGDGLSVLPIALLPEAAGQPLRMRMRLRFLVFGPLGVLDQVLSQPQPFWVPEEVAPEIWQALDLAPRPGLLFDVPVQFVHEREPVPRVSQVLRMDTIALGEVKGRTVTGSGEPLSGMRVSTLDGLVTTHTDARGYFALRGVPVGDPVRLVITGRGLRFGAEIQSDSPEPVVINCEI